MVRIIFVNKYKWQKEKEVKLKFHLINHPLKSIILKKLGKATNIKKIFLIINNINNYI